MAVAALGVFWLILHIAALKNQVRPIRRDAVPMPAVQQKKKANIRRLIPDNPADYGIIIASDEGSVEDQENINMQIQLVIEELRENQPPEMWEKVQELIQEDPKVTLEKLEKIDEQIQELQQKLKDDPENEDAKEKVQRLMTLKSISQVLTK